MKKISIIISIFLILISCKSPNASFLHGNWVINEIIYNEKDIVNAYLSINVLVIHKDGKCQFPSFTDAYGIGTWNVVEKNDKSEFIIESTDPVFKGKFNMSINNELTDMALSNQTTTIKCTKAFNLE